MESITVQKAEGKDPAGSSLSFLDRQARRGVLRRLVRLDRGTLTLVEQFTEDGVEREIHCGAPAADGLAARVEVLDTALYRRLALGGTVGAAESFMEGEWTTEDLTSVIRLLVRNRQAMEGLEGGWARLRAPLLRLFHRSRANSRRGARRNIEEHYDLGNEFFATFLDETMMYSAAYFERPEATLGEASLAKLDRLCRKLDLRPQDHVLEIGTGWGGFACHAAEHYGCRVTTTTISPAQHAYATERVEAAGLEDRVTLLQEDYRDLEGEFDKLVSIEMIEAVGLENVPTFFEVCAARLKADGLMALQAITIEDRYYEAAAGSVDFIQRYIFPGSGIPSLGAMTQAVARKTDLTLFHLEDIGQHYARTLRLWRQRFHEQREIIRQQGFSQSFQRMWEFYFAYCEGGFLERSISDVQMILARPGARPSFTALPPSSGMW